MRQAIEQSKTAAKLEIIAKHPSRKDLVFLFIAIFLVMSYIAPRWSDWNQNSRVNLVRAIVDKGTVQIDAFIANTGDYAFYNGHYYSDKPPGPALAGVLPYAALKMALSNPLADKALEIAGNSRTFSQSFSEGSNTGTQLTTSRDKLIGALARIVLAMFLVSIPVSIMACLFLVWACELTGRYWASLALSLALIFGTTLFPYSSMFYNHALTAALLFSGFFLLYRLQNSKGQPGWLILSGFLLGFSIISQYETVLIAAVLGLYSLATVERLHWLHRILWIAIGILPSVIILVAYDLVAFGTPFPVGYSYSTLWLDRHSQGFMSLTLPHLEALWGITFSQFRGIFLLSPFLLLAIPGFYYGLRNVGNRLEAIVCLWASAAFLTFNSSSIMWAGGHAFGPRYIVSCLPFMSFGIVFLLKEAAKEKWKFAGFWFGIPAVFSVLVVMFGSIAGRNWPSDEFENPVRDFLLPELLSGNLARNPGTALGLKGFYSFLPLLLALCILYLLLYRLKKPRRRMKVTSENNLIGFQSAVEVKQYELIPMGKSKPSFIGRFWLNGKWLVTLVTTLVILFSTLPYLFGYLRTPPNKTFMGIMLDVPDTTQYWAWMRSFGDSWIIGNPLTPEKNDPAFFNLLWLILGKAQFIIGIGQEWVYQLFRIFSIVFFSLMLWRFTRFVFNSPLSRNTAYLLVMFGCGWGWLPILIKQFSGTLSNPLAVFVSEPNTFLSALANPHLIFSASLILWIFQLVLLASEESNLKYAVGAGFIALILGLEHAYDLLIVYSVIGLFWFSHMWLKHSFDVLWFKICLIIGLLSAFPSIYFTYITITNPTWKGVLAQYGNAGVFTPDPFNLLILLGPLLLLAFYALTLKAPAVKESNISEYSQYRMRLVKIWFIAGCFLIYIPANFQIKMLNGWQVPLFMLTIVAIIPLAKRLHAAIDKISVNDWAKILCVGAILIALPTTIYLFSWRFVDLNRVTAPYYLERDELSAMNWLEQRNKPPEIVLASETLGYYIAPKTGNRPFLAHWAMTLDYYTKRTLVAEVMNPATTSTRRAEILKEYKVTYILYGSEDKKLSPALDDPNLQKVFSSIGADIYLYTPLVSSAGGNRV
ncbi:hypothetical protein [Candidatus Chlorohelix sp.]|uniref:hypothetical protein n=1 Tax=Candidatus Chlorohelix sp. TaxID=3139201 RepID=UPI003034FAA2